MIDESLLKSNFVGRDGFRWWIGQVAPEDAQGGQINGEGWGNRRKVRIMGYHPHDLPNFLIKIFRGHSVCCPQQQELVPEIMELMSKYYQEIPYSVSLWTVIMLNFRLLSCKYCK
jgi:hypothetical protein